MNLRLLLITISLSITAIIVVAQKKADKLFAKGMYSDA